MFSKAFDKVSHEKLVHKLHGYGVRGKILSWIRVFINGKSQTVVLEGGGWRGSAWGSISNIWCPAGICPWVESLPDLHKWPPCKGKVPSETVVTWQRILLSQSPQMVSTFRKISVSSSSGKPIGIWTLIKEMFGITYYQIKIPHSN